MRCWGMVNGDEEGEGSDLPEDTLQVALGGECDALYACYCLWPGILGKRNGEQETGGVGRDIR